MPHIVAYHRPSSMDEALRLLVRPEVRSRVLGGGTVVTAEPWSEPFEVIDLQALGLAGITGDEEHVSIEAMTTLADIAGDERIPELLRTLARREAPSTLRNQATIGGLVASADPESELLAGLLVHDARIAVVHQGGGHKYTLDQLWDDDDALVAGVITRVDLHRAGRGAVERTGRTPADRSIVSAVAWAGDDGDGVTIRLALTGVADRPVLVSPAGIGGLRPSGDFRGSSRYRAELARILSERVVRRVIGAR